jgi:hypothetical protein
MAQSVPMPDSHAHQNPVQPLREEAYPLQTEIEQQHRTLHTHTFIEVRSPHQPEVGRLMVTEVDCYGVRRNRQPEFFLNGIVGHIRADRHGWIDSWEQSTQLANTGVVTSISLKCTMSRTLGAITHKSLTMLLNQTEAKNHYRDQGWTTDSITANAGAAAVPSQIHQLAAVLWDILNNDRDSNAAILEKLENPGDDLSTNPVFTAADLAHLASYLAQTTHVLSQQAQQMEELSDIDD